MIDYVKIWLKDFLPSELECNTLLDFYNNINLSTGEIKTVNRRGNKVTASKLAYYNGLEFKIYDTGTVMISGSLHVYWNAGAHNYNDFDNRAVLWVLSDLKGKFNILPQNCILKCLEIGVNVIPPISTKQILNNCLLHKTKSFEYQINSNEGKFKQVRHSQYVIKIYDKAMHYQSKGFRITGKIMRFEIKYTKMEKLNKMSIFTLQDVMNYGLQNFKKEIINEWENVLYYDNTIQIDPLTKIIENKLLKYSNPLYWCGLLANHQNKNFIYHKNQLKRITLQNSDKVQDSISEIISKKIDFLNRNPIQIDPLNIVSDWIGFTDQNNTYCKVTGINISMQKSNSILLSHTGLKYYHQTDRKIFEQIKRRYLTKVWKNSDFKTQIKELAHNIRNAHYSQKTKQSKIYLPQQVNLLSELGV